MNNYIIRMFIVIIVSVSFSVGCSLLPSRKVTYAFKRKDIIHKQDTAIANKEIENWLNVEFGGRATIKQGYKDLEEAFVVDYGKLPAVDEKTGKVKYLSYRLLVMHDGERIYMTLIPIKPQLTYEVNRRSKLTSNFGYKEFYQEWQRLYYSLIMNVRPASLTLVQE